MPNDDIKVGLKVTLDDESMAREVSRAEARLGKAGSGGRPPRGSGGPTDLGEALRTALVRPIVDKLDKIEEKLGKAGVSANTASNLASLFIAYKILQEILYAMKAVVASIWNLTQSLSQFSPALRVAFSSLFIAMRMIAIDLGRLIGPNLSKLVYFIRDLVTFLYAVFRPVIDLLFRILGFLVDRLRILLVVIQAVYVRVLQVIANVIRAVGDLLTWLGQYLPGTLGDMFTKLGASAESIAKAIEGYAKTIKNATASTQNAAQSMNSALIKGFSDLGKQSYVGVTAPGPMDSQVPPQFKAPLVMDPHGTGRVYRSAPTSVAAGRTAVPVQTPSLASVVNNVQLKAEVKMQHEEAVQRAIEEVRSCLVKAIHCVRNEQLLLSSRIYARTVIDL